MSKIDYDSLLKSPQRAEKKDIVEDFKNMGKLNLKKIKDNEKNIYPIINIEELANSILQFGLSQAIEVKDNGNDTYTIISGHRRKKAFEYLVEQGYKEYNYIPYTLTNNEEDEIISEIKLHDTNLQTRPLNKMSDLEKIAIIKTYISLIEKAKEKGILINGKEVKGKTREVLADMLDISARTAQTLMTKAKGGKIATQKSQQEKIEEKCSKVLKDINIIIEDGNYKESFSKEVYKLAKELRNNQKKIIEIDENQLSIDKIEK